MSNQTEKLNAAGSVSPDSYVVDQALLHPSNKTEPIDIREMLMKLEFVESIHNPYIEGNIFVQDSANILSLLRLNGNEKLELKIQKQKQDESKEEDEDTKWEFETRIIEIYDYARTSPSRQFYHLRIASPHLIANQAKLLKRPFKGTIGNTIQQIIKNDLSIERIENINTSTKTPVSGVFPRLRPLIAANWLLKNAYEDSTPFYFYETIKKGIYLDSLKKMFEKEPYKTFELKSFFANNPGTPGYYDEVSRRIKSFSSPVNFSQFSNIGEGVYSSKVHKLDIYKKEYVVDEYRYNGDNKLNEFQPYSSNDKVNENDFKDNTESKNYYISLNTGQKEDNYHSPNDNTIMKAKAQLKGLESNTMEMLITGDFGLEVGSIIQVDVSKASSADQLEESTMFDKYLGGKYLVKEIKSYFTQSFEQKVTLMRDSVGVDIDSSEPEEQEKTA